MANRSWSQGQVYITNGAVITSDVTGRVAGNADRSPKSVTLTLSTTGGAGTFTIHMANGTTGTVTSGTATITGSVVTLAAGSNTITSNGAGDCTLVITCTTTACNWDDVNSWSDPDVAVGKVGATVPTSSDAVKVDALSVAGAGAVLSQNVANASFASMDWTGATNNPVFALPIGFTNTIAYGNVTFIVAMTTTGTVQSPLLWNASGTLTTNGCVLNCYVQTYLNNPTLTLGDALTATYNVSTYTGSTLTTAGYPITTGSFKDNALNATFNLGASVITATDGVSIQSGSTVNAGTSTIKVGTGAFTGGSKTYYNVELLGSAHALSGNNTFTSLKLGPATTQAITGTGTQTVGAMSRTGTGVITWNGPEVTKTAGPPISLKNMSISNSNALPATNTWYAGYGSVDGGGNTGWIFNDNPATTGGGARRTAELLMMGAI
jgi:hypothetical protein